MVHYCSSSLQKSETSYTEICKKMMPGGDPVNEEGGPFWTPEHCHS